MTNSPLKLTLLLLLLLIGLLLPARAQDYEAGDNPDLTGLLMEQTLIETTEVKSGNRSLIVDNTRSKIGRDFYDAFHQRWVSIPTDTTRKGKPGVELNPTEFLIIIEELPTVGIGNLLNISINDQLVWQVILQPCLELIEENAINASEYLFQYVTVLPGYSEPVRHRRSDGNRNFLTRF